jgi:small subunit ribosomal protein S17
MKGLVGKISSNKMTGTVAVTVEAFKMHPIYKKRLRRTRRYLAQTGEQKLQVGDLVYITETRPISKQVHFKVSGVLNRAEILTDVKQATKDVEAETEHKEVKKVVKKDNRETK